MPSKASRRDTSSKFLGMVVNRHVFFAAITILILSVALTLIFKEDADQFFLKAQDSVSAHGGWIYILVINIFIIFSVYIAFSKYGKIRLGGPKSKPEYSLWAWFAMLFSTGLGVGLLLFSIADPVMDFLNPPRLAGEDPGLIAQEALNFSFMHYGIHGWAVYALVGLALAYFTYNRKMPLTLRSAFYPILGNRVYGWMGDVIDVMAVLTTIFGLATSIGFGAGQVNSGLTHVFGISSSTYYQIIIILVITLIATLSAFSGVDKGVKMLSILNMRMAIILFLAVVILGPTTFIIKSYIQSLGSYFSHFIEMSAWTVTFTEGNWQKTRTIMYWGWWISWSPFVGTFIARISKGRSIKEFILGVLFLPSMVTLLWFTAFGAVSLQDILMGDMAIADAVNADITTALYVFFDRFPLAIALKILGLVLIIFFIITSADSGALVVDSITSGGKLETPKFQRVIWAVCIGVVASVLLYGGGLTALQTAVTISGIPFAIILLGMCYSLFKGIRQDHREYELRQEISEEKSYRKKILKLVKNERESKTSETNKTQETTQTDTYEND